MLAVARPHQPVLERRIVELLVHEGPAATADEGILVDTTLGAGGHAAALLEASAPGVVLVGIDRDPTALDLAARRLEPFASRARLVHRAFDDLTACVDAAAADAGPVLGVLYDLGVSSMQLDTGARGFSFRAEAPLDMRMDPTSGQTAAELLATVGEADLVELLFTLGEERYARRIARALVDDPPATTLGLADRVAAAVPASARHGRTHPATRTFQALRIAVNAELDRFRASLPQALELATPAPGTPPASRGGRVAVLAYHSLEDRIAKQAFADALRGCICPPDLPVCACGRTPRAVAVTRGSETPTADEVGENPRARSARLRAGELLPRSAS